MLDRGLMLPQLLARRAAEHPDRVFLQDVGGRSMTYRELHEANLTWADAYRRIGVQEGENVATMLLGSFEAYCAWLGLSWLRAVEVPVNRMYRGRMLEYILGDSQARIVVAGHEFLPQIAAVAGNLGRVETLVVPDADEVDVDLPFEVICRDRFFEGAVPAEDVEGPAPYDVSGIVYTSGTTGPSKGVMVPWAAAYHFSGWFPEEALGEGDAFYSFWPPFHVTGKAAIYLPALRNGRLVMREIFSVGEFWNDVRRFGCTAGYLLGPFAQLLFSQPERPDDAENPLVTVAGVPLVPEVNDFKARFGITKYSTGFGMTETGSVFITDGLGEVTDWQTCGRVRTGPPGYRVRIVDEHDEEVPVGEVGELVVRTDEPWAMNVGYFGMPEKTAEAWRNGWFHTGDAFRVDDEGNYYFVDRVKDAIRRRGENISSFEVEAYVGEHPDVAECAAIGVPSELGEDEVKVCVVRVPGSELLPEQLIEFLVPNMPRFMIPRYVEFVDELPKTDATGRVKKAELKPNALNVDTWDREKAGITLPR